MNDEASLLDILIYGRRAIRAANEKDVFLRDEIAQSAVAYCISVMGEAVKRISPEFQKGHPEVEWSDIARMRDLLVHAYHRVNWEMFGTRWLIIYNVWWRRPVVGAPRRRQAEAS